MEEEEIKNLRNLRANVRQTRKKKRKGVILIQQWTKHLLLPNKLRNWNCVASKQAESDAKNTKHAPIRNSKQMWAIGKQAKGSKREEGKERKGSWLTMVRKLIHLMTKVLVLPILGPLLPPKSARGDVLNHWILHRRAGRPTDREKIWAGGGDGDRDEEREGPGLRLCPCVCVTRVCVSVVRFVRAWRQRLQLS